ncbi:hypothetical protein [Aquitalea aquatica]|uniref:DUF2635 domain-containing protein n=1 Tax=Aquitalea aquatica TaxID=3044273 RepID=A0A838Y877_9NEIS|nr:hypothetical protein [Aquitalea magnusonii]MBA4709572.1 hypothetical protein [Aquitalea magnusonii]
MKVIANNGLLVPMEGQPRRYIGDGEAVTVEDSAYYRRQIADGDLSVLDEAVAEATAAADAVAAKVPDESDSKKGNV